MQWLKRCLHLVHRDFPKHPLRYEVITMPVTTQQEVKFTVTWTKDSDRAYIVTVIRDGTYYAKGMVENPNAILKLTSQVIWRTVNSNDPFDSFASNWGS